MVKLRHSRGRRQGQKYREKAEIRVDILVQKDTLLSFFLNEWREVAKHTS